MAEESTCWKRLARSWKQVSEGPFDYPASSSVGFSINIYAIASRACSVKIKLTVLSTLAIVTILSLTSIASAFSGSISLTDPNWTVYNRYTTNGSQTTKTSAPAIQTATLLQFPFPNAGSSTSNPTYTGFLLDKISLSLTNTQTITATFSVPATSSGTTFVGNPNGYACGTATSVRLFFQSTGTGNPSGLTSTTFETHYWWANPTDGSIGSYRFITGVTTSTVTLSVPLQGFDWSDFYGHFGTGSFAANFNAALGAIKYIGLSFGSGCFFANGVGVDYATGTADFQLLSYTIS
jgi:hypothetical protein